MPWISSVVFFLAANFSYIYSQSSAACFVLLCSQLSLSIAVSFSSRTAEMFFMFFYACIADIGRAKGEVAKALELALEVLTGKNGQRYGRGMDAH